MMRLPYPAIVLRRREGEDEIAFQARKDHCRNAVAATGYPSPEHFESNIYDDPAEVFPSLERFPAVFAYEAADLADTRDEFALCLQAIEDAGINLVLVQAGVDLRGGDVVSDASRKAFTVWRGFAAAGPMGYVGPDVGEPIPRRPKGMTDDLETTARLHYIEHGTGAPAALKRAAGLTSSGTASNWLKWVERNPAPVTGAQPGEE